jgi:hypothetical protein
MILLNGKSSWGQIGYTVPTAIIVENSAYTAPVYEAEVDIIMREDFGNSRRPIATRIGKYKTDKKGAVTVSLLPNKSYTITTTCNGFYTQIAKINTKNYSRTRENRKGISLRPRNVMAIAGNIIAKKNIKIIGQVSIKNKTTQHTEKQQLALDGSYFMKVLAGTEYELRVLVDGYLDTMILLTDYDLQGSTVTAPYQLDFELNPPQPNHRKGDTLKLDNMLFVGRSLQLAEEIWIDTLASILEEYTKVRVKINVYTDSRRSDRINYILAKKRIEVVRTKLQERGISPRRYLFEAKGEDDIVNGCEDGRDCTKEQHEINNRVVIVIASGQFRWFKEKEEL